MKDHPVKSWIPHRDDILDGLIRLEGRGIWWTEGCSRCREPNAAWRCEDCFGGRLLCTSCIMEKHRNEPLHLLQEWEDGFFQPRTTRALGLRYQLGHSRGEECPWVRLTHSRKDFVVLHNNGIHVIDVDFCGCSNAPKEVDQLLNIGWYPATSREPSTAASLSLLRRFHKLNLQARVPAYDFYNTLVQLTNAAGLNTLPNRLPQFMNMVREYRHLQMCKRAGRAHHPTGIVGTSPGELAIPCRACPHPNINLPGGWEDAPPEVAWIYRLLISKDANFKMKGRDRSSREKDPTLGPGWAYMVANDEYLRHLAKYVDEDEISHCVSFAALWSANNKRAKGLRASGIGSVSCSRHEMFRPLGTGDLQRGERQCNMDYLFFSSLIGITMLMLVASYDIACQWSRKLWSRAEKMPASMRLSSAMKVIFKVPKFHLPPHVKACHAPFSFNYTKGVGRTDGEGVERNWSWLNSAARSISVMGPGAREDTIDDLCGFSNWKKTVDFGNSLLRKMVLAIPQAMVHSRAFHAFTEGLREGHQEELMAWEKIVRAWEADDEHQNDLADPYDYVDVEGSLIGVANATPAETMADVMKRIAEEDHARVVANVKRRNPTTIQATALQRQRTLLLGQISKLDDIQGQYMPGLPQWIARQNPPVSARDSSKPETIKIHLPSSLPAADRDAICTPGLVAQEESLRNAQAHDSLRDLRRGLRTRTFAHRFKRQHLSGQGMYTKSRSLLDGIESSIREAASRYRAARAALFALRGPGAWEKVLQVLQKEDIRGMNERLMNAEEKEENRKARVLAGLPADGQGDEFEFDEFGERVDLTVLFNLETGEGRRLLSWIWYTGSTGGTDQTADGLLHPDIRVEWMKARARADRWKEELILVEEEMRRVLAFGEWQARWWRARVEPKRGPARATISSELAEGLRAYALEQVAREEAWVAVWSNKWGKVRARTAVVLRNHLGDGEGEELVPIEVELDGDEEEQAFFEDVGFEDEED
ncbi:hypothetical protein K438DRAFT_1588036 [Mycena galopus ATCC 62051]|nr:hypothetical protein K438DRAFT_1606926 [Mycena galopus ATCC 62051]KAF8194446.1 hypothetical protein K438DRAFT_1588036 [Mycena galopus ATCC 62051]